MADIDKQMKENWGLLVTVAKTFKPRSQQQLDAFIHEGSIGLWKAIQKHDPKRGKLSTVAWHYIRWAIIAYIDKFKKYHTVGHPTPACLEKTYKEQGGVWELLSDDLTDEEREIVCLYSIGHTYKELGDKFKVSPSTIKNRYKSAITKLRNANEALKDSV